MNHRADEGFVRKMPPGARSLDDIVARSPGGLELGYLALLAGRAVQSAVEDAADRVGLPSVDLLSLYILGVHDGLPGGTLARLMRVQQSTVTAVADRLEAAGLICRTRDEADRRRVWLCPTERGEQLLERSGAIARDIVRQIFAPVGRAEADQLASLLGRVVEPWLAGIVPAGDRS